MKSQFTFTKKQYLFASIAWVIIIFVLCTLPASNAPKFSFSIPYLDKLIHAIFYMVLSFLLLNTFKQYGHALYKAIPYTLIITILYGIGIEWIQDTFLSSRYFEIQDIIANIIGSFVGLAFFQINR